MRLCEIEGCNIKHFSKGYCRKHYARFWRTGDPLFIHPKFNHSSLCSIDGCNNKYKAKGLCQTHLSRIERHGDVNWEHPMKHSKDQELEYRVYRTMISRCYDETQDSYKYYGRKGIEVCDRWLNSFQDFYFDMGKRPSNNYQIDREKNNENYTPDNCRWVTAAVNAQNRSSNVVNWFTVKSIRRLYSMKKYTQVQLSKIYNVSTDVIYRIVHNKTWIEAV